MAQDLLAPYKEAVLHAGIKSLLLPSYVTLGKSFQLSNPQLRG